MSHPYESFPQDLAKAKSLKAELDLAMTEANKTGQTQKAEELAHQTQTHIEQMENKLWPFQEQLPGPELKKQYDSQKEIQAKNSLLFPLSTGELGIKDQNQKEYPFPTLEQIQKELKNNPELKKKMEQDFTQIQITPFALPLSTLTEAVSHTILKHKKENKLFTAKKDPNDPNEALVPLKLDENQPLWAWNNYQEEEMVYFPKQFDETNHQGQTKQHVLQNQTTFHGYLITLQEKTSISQTERKRMIKGTLQNRDKAKLCKAENKLKPIKPPPNI